MYLAVAGMVICTVSVAMSLAKLHSLSLYLSGLGVGFAISGLIMGFWS